MIISLIVCTYNRCGSLAIVLNNAAALALPPSVDWEVLVVDNNSSDQTRELVEGWRCRYGNGLRYVFEARQGLSHARNTGIREARGDIVVFTDDDVTFDASWLQNLTAQLGDGKWAGAGGRVVPVWNCPRPRWLSPTSRYAVGPLVMFDLGPDAGETFEAPFGANMAFKKSMFDKYGGFRTDLGRSADVLLSGEDSEFGTRLLVAGERLRYEPSAIVFHPVPAKRVRKSYFLAWWFNNGRSTIRQSESQANTRSHLARVLLHLLRSTVKWALLWAITIDPCKRFERKLIVWQKLGQITECYRRTPPTLSPTCEVHS